MTKLELLVGAEAFWARAAGDLDRAGERVLVQAMTFEGDAAGAAVAAAIAGSRARDRRVLVDDYSRWTVSDRWVLSPTVWFDGRLQAERRATDAMFRGLAAAGVGVRRTNPVGPLFVHYPARNHKKLIVADDVAYVGGVNFSDHNFAWHDFMLRLEGGPAADRLAADFAATYAGRPGAWRADLGDVRLMSLDGRTNAGAFGEIADLIGAARREITVISPYLTFPVTGALARAAAAGVRVRLITPLGNNKPAVRDHLIDAAARSGFEIALLPGMSHLKGLLIDDDRLVVGSSNFDFVSLAAEEELLAVVADRALVAEFRRRIIAPALAEALPPGVHRVSRWRGVGCLAALLIADQFARAARNAPRRAVAWLPPESP